MGVMQTGRFFEVRFESIGGLGAHAAGQVLATAAVLRMGLNGAHFSSYGSEKKGSLVRSFVRLGPADRPVRTSAPVETPDAIVVFHAALLKNAATFGGLRRDGVLPYNAAAGPIPAELSVMRAARRCREAWHSLQELAGIHNSHAERLLARERELAEDVDRGVAIPAVPASATPAAAATPAGVTIEPEVADEAVNPDDAYIETARCTTCNECTQINNRMFVYNENRQAYIADPDAGTYAQMVEAAESCQVSIIHPGKPRNTSEPGLTELLKRAEVFA